MDAARAFALLLAAHAVVAHLSRDNILRIQLWDDQGLTKVPRVVAPPARDVPKADRVKSSLVNRNDLDSVKAENLMGEMFNTFYESESSKVENKRFTRLNGIGRKTHRSRTRHHRRRKVRDNTNNRSNIDDVDVENELFNDRLEEEPGARRGNDSSRPLLLRFHEDKRPLNVFEYSESSELSDHEDELSRENRTKDIEQTARLKDALGSSPEIALGYSISALAKGDPSLEGSRLLKNIQDSNKLANNLPGGGRNENGAGYSDVNMGKATLKNESVDAKNASDPAALIQDSDDSKSDKSTLTHLSKQLAVVPKCCPSGQNLSKPLPNGDRLCQPSILTFQPLFYDFNSTHMWIYESNLYETIVGNPCTHQRYKLDPEQFSEDEFYLITNGTLFAPYHAPRLRGAREFCMEAFWDPTSPAGLTMPLVCFSTPPTDEAGISKTFILYSAGLLLSVPFLLATVAAYLLTPALRNTHGFSLASHAACLAVAFVCLATTQLGGQSFSETFCTAIAFLIQFSFVACFFWLNVLCFDTWYTARHYLTREACKRSERRRFAAYCAYAWGLPSALLAVSLIMHFTPTVPASYLKPNFGVTACWFKTDRAALPYFYGPVAIILSINVLLFVLTSRAFSKHHARLSVVELTHPEITSDDWYRLGQALGGVEVDSSPTTSADSSPSHDRHMDLKRRWKDYRRIFRMCCILSFIMGLSWITEVISWAAGGDSPIWSLFDVVNALQGVVIFLLFVMLRPVRTIVWESLKKSGRCSRWRKNDSAQEEISERTAITSEDKGKRVYV